MVTANQIVVVLISGGNDPIYKAKDFKQVLIYKKNEKYAFTYIISVTKTEEVFTIKVYRKKKTQQLKLILKFLQTVYNLRHQFTSNSNKH